MSNYVFFDVETTGLDHTADQVIEIAAVKTNDKLRAVSSFHETIRLESGRELSPFITEITGLDAESLANSPAERDTLEKFAEFVSDDSIIVAHNAPFDISFTFGRLNKKNPPFICTRAMTFLANPFESASLAAACTRYNISTSGHHHALNDAIMCLYLFEALRKEVCNYLNTVIGFDDRPINYVPDHARILSSDIYREQFERKAM